MRKRVKKNKDFMFLILIIICFIVSAPIVAAQTKVFESIDHIVVNDNKPVKEETLEKVEKPVKGEKPVIDNNKDEGTVDVTEKPNFVLVEKDYFDKALFIGDSRTVGLSEYGDLKNATYFANSGMSVYNIMNEKVPVANHGKISLEELLMDNTYDKIYVMLGINELGYNFNTTVEKYEKVVDNIVKLQPRAIIFLEANMHVTDERNSTDKIFNNANIDKLNSKIETIKDNKKIFYIDINDEFDDEEGNLKAEYSSDNTHLLGKYYLKWTNWLTTVGVQVK